MNVGKTRGVRMICRMSQAWENGINIVFHAGENVLLDRFHAKLTDFGSAGSFKVI